MRFKLIATFETKTGSESSITPGDLVVYDGQLCVALNRSDTGYLLRDCNSSESIQVDKKQSLEIVKKIYIEKR